MPHSYAVLGAGGWGTAVAIHLANQDHSVRLWAARTEWANQLKSCRQNVRLLPGVPIPEAVAITANPAEAVCDITDWIIAIPTAFLRDTLAPFRSLVQTDTRLLSLTKGIERGTFLRPTEILLDLFGARTVGALSGPSHAEEMARGLPTSVVVAGSEESYLSQIQYAFNSDRFRVYRNRDLLGVELAGALKNVFGIAAGICDGLKFGDNAKAALLARSIVEMTRFGVALGAEASTFTGLAGIGDLIATSFSPHGRNRRVGERLGKGERREDVLDTPQVAEGVWTARSVQESSIQHQVETPIMSAVYEVLYESKSPLDAVRELMNRQVREEGEW